MKIDKAAKLAVKNILKEGLTDIFPQPAEIILLKNKYFQYTISQKTAKCIKGNSLDSLDILPIDHVLLPKGGPFDFRRCALIQPLDTIKYLGLVLTIADEIEKHRPAKVRKMVYSYRFKPNKGYLFDPKYNITSFKKYVANKVRTKNVKTIVSCDIANFYDRLNLHRLESILLSCGLDPKRVKLINELLLFWSNRDSYSLPVGSNASRVLAEAALIEVDNYLISLGIKFCRFVDDYRLFAPNSHVAHHWLTQLIERLWLEGLTINMRKTKIEDVSELKKEPDEEKTGEIREPKTIVEKRAEKDIPEPQFIIRAGYGGTIPTRFRKPKKSEIEKFKTSNSKEILKSLKSQKITEPEDIKKFIKSILATGKYHYFRYLPDISILFPQFTPYLVDILIKYNDKISVAIKKQISIRFSKLLKTEKYLPEYIAISVVKLLGIKGFEDKSTLLDYFRGLKRNAGSYIGRTLLDSLEDLVTRGEVVEIRKYFNRADAWEKRQIVRIVDKHLSDEEKRPWLKNVKTTEARDLFLVEYIKPTKKKKMI